MKPTRPDKLRELKDEELVQKLAEEKENLFKLKVRKETRQLEDTASVKVSRRNVARLETLVRQKQQKQPAAPAAAGKES